MKSAGWSGDVPRGSVDERALSKDWPLEVLYKQWDGDAPSGGVRQVHDVFFCCRDVSHFIIGGGLLNFDGSASF